MTIFNILRLTNAILFFLLAILHIYWAFGSLLTSNSISMAAVIPETSKGPVLKPGFAVTMAVAFGLLVAAAISFFAMKPIYKGASVAFVSEWWCVYGNLAIAIIFLVRAIGDFRYVGFFKKVHETKFAIYDTLFYSPLCFLIACVALYLYLQIRY